jgi:hypothetical protein
MCNRKIKVDPGRMQKLSITFDSLISQDSRHVGDMRKINEKGELERFEGITIVMHAKTNKSVAFQQAYDLLHNSYGESYAVLPVSSYHVTLCDIQTLNRMYNLTTYNDFLTKNKEHFELLKWIYANESESVTFLIADVESWGSVIVLKLKPKTEKDQQVLQSLENKTKQTWHLYKQQIINHMTLAYRIPNSKQKELEIITKLKEIFADVDVECEMPQVCTFKDMSLFNPL